MQLDMNTALKPLRRQKYINKDISMDKQTLQKPAPSRSGPVHGGHYDAYVSGNPRLKKYFGGTFSGSI